MEKQYEAIIEAILFTMGDAIEIEKIAQAIELNVAQTKKILEDMAKRYEKEDRGIDRIGKFLSAQYQKRNV